MKLTQLKEEFAIPGVLDFHETGSGLIYAEVTTPAATATVYLQGAHITHWQPAGEQPVLFMSAKSDFEHGKPIRGGVPIAFPWFANRHDGKEGPSHGFARILDWTLAFAAQTGDDLHLTFTLGANDLSRSLGFDHFRCAFQLTLGRTLTMQFTVANEASTPLVFEEALHTYFSVSDVRNVSVTGLESTSFIDKTDNFAVKPALNGPLHFTAFTDRIYDHTTATCVIHDPGMGRTIHIAKENSDTTVVFNPWKALADMDESQWPHMLCVETVNASASPVTLAPGATHTMKSIISVERSA